VKELATKALLTPAEVGTGFTQGNYTPNDPNTPTACGSKSADAVVPPGVQVGTVIQNGTTNQAMLEEIAVYNDANQAGQAYTAGTNGLACTTGTVPGSGDKVTISAPQDLTSQFEESTKATGWQISGADIQAIVVAVQLQAAIVTFQFQAPAGVDATQPDPIAVAKTGYTKVHNS
jgi:hypothetical protein